MKQNHKILKKEGIPSFLLIINLFITYIIFLKKYKKFLIKKQKKSHFIAIFSIIFSFLL